MSSGNSKHTVFTGFAEVAKVLADIHRLEILDQVGQGEAQCRSRCGTLVWIGQGTGYFPYPRSSVIFEKLVWVYRGACLAGVGVVTIVIGQKL